MGRKTKEMVWITPDFDTLEGYKAFKNASTLAEQRKAFFRIKEINTAVRTIETETKDGKKKTKKGLFIPQIYQRFLIDLTKGLVNTLDNTYFSDIASQELRDIVDRLVKKNLKTTVIQGMTVDRLNQIVQDVFLYVCTKFDPLNDNCTIATFIFRNQKRIMGNIISAESDQLTEANLKTDAAVTKLINDLKNQGKEDTILNIAQLAKEQKVEKGQDVENEVNAMTPAKIRNSLMRIKQRENTSSLYATTEDDTIEINIQSHSKDMANPESLYLETEHSEKIIEALDKIGVDFGDDAVEIFLSVMGLTIEDNGISRHLADTEPEKIEVLAKQYNKTVNEVKRLIRHVQDAFARAINPNDENTTVKWVDNVLEKNKVPFVGMTNEDREELEDFESIIELSDF